MRYNDPGIEAAAKAIYEAGRFCRWWRFDKAYEGLDPIGKQEFDGVISKALEAADAARQEAHSGARKSGQKSEIVLCLLPLIESGRAGLRADAAAADLIAACARFNAWFAEQKTARQGSVDGFLQLLDFYEQVTLECHGAVQRFIDGGERRELADTLQRAAEKLNQRRDWISN
jgi:hypothetical protein